MKHIYYKNDFESTITFYKLENGELIETSPPTSNYEIIFTDGSRKYRCSKDKGNLKEINNKAVCYIGKHGFKLGLLFYTLRIEQPNMQYQGKTYVTETPAILDIELWDKPSDIPGTILITSETI